MLAHTKISAIVFFVRDLARTQAFYRDALGLTVEPQDSQDGPFAIAPVGDLTLVFIVRPSKAGDSPVVVFDIGQGIDDCAETLAAKGVEIVVPVSDCPDGGLSVDFVDPDRNQLSLYQPPGMPRRR
jgi:predicted enzyme related to lactoylglutathione lyase